LTLAIPKILVLDSATIGKVSKDYWDSNIFLRNKARTFINRLQYLSVFVTFTATHLIELFRYGDEQVVQARLRFLRRIPLIAWLRSYDNSQLPGGIPDLLLRELHVVVHSKIREWREIVDAVRPELWEMGIGSKTFLDNDEFLSDIKRWSHHLLEKEIYTESIARTDPGQMSDVKLCEVLRLPLRAKEERDAYIDRFAQELQKQLEQHGDERFDNPQKAAIDFANSTLQDVKAVDEIGGNPIQILLKSVDVPLELLYPEMTCREFGELAIYANRLKKISKSLCPPIELTINDIPPDTLPSYVLERKLALIQRKAERVSGSNMGDRHITPLIFYSYGVEVDKRTYELLNQVRRKEPKLASLMGKFFPSSDYSQIPELFEE